ncbi:hypothetical protein QJS65_20455 (plasmid) [Bacillus altitudinis]|uniref:hypothetical protein n=1 Tax=Bacillus altitudinis TaxID=293387 RepID=UPI0024A83874|nr:hypothetical protein [Bacillus altitudinis]WHF29120.1 hypothetical protein QJS65_20455 [Bacillus altitudinis]
MKNEVFNHENIGDMIGFVESYIQDKEFVIHDYATHAHAESLGIDIYMKSTWRFNNVGSLFTLFFGTHEDVKNQLDYKIEELKRLRVT